jgi:hypothetical protein
MLLLLLLSVDNLQTETWWADYINKGMAVYRQTATSYFDVSTLNSLNTAVSADKLILVCISKDTTNLAILLSAKKH